MLEFLVKPRLLGSYEYQHRESLYASFN